MGYDFSVCHASSRICAQQTARVVRDVYARPGKAGFPIEEAQTLMAVLAQNEALEEMALRLVSETKGTPLVITHSENIAVFGRMMGIEMNGNSGAVNMVEAEFDKEGHIVKGTEPVLTTMASTLG